MSSSTPTIGEKNTQNSESSRQNPHIGANPPTLDSGPSPQKGANGSNGVLSPQQMEAMRHRYIEETTAAIQQTTLVDKPFDKDLLISFARAVLRRADDRYIRMHSGLNLPDQLIHSLCMVWRRPKSDIKVRVFNPTADQDGYTVTGTVIETLMPDQPFIFDTIKLFLEISDVVIKNSTNVIIDVVRDEEGRLLSVGTGNGSPESYCRLLIEQVPEDPVCRVYESEIRARLHSAALVTRDFHRMKKMAADAKTLYEYLASIMPNFVPYLTEAIGFIDWLMSEHFVFMGALSCRSEPGKAVEVVPQEGLGIGSARRSPGLAVDQEKFKHFSADRPVDKYFIQVRKSDTASTVHRTGKIDEILIKRFDLDGRLIGGVVLMGLFTHKAIRSRGGDIPILQAKLKEILSAEDVRPDGHDYKAITDAFNSLPVEYLFNATAADITRLIRTMLLADLERRTRSHLAIEPGARSAYLFVVVPKAVYTDDIRVRVQAHIKQSLGATYVDHRSFFGKNDSVMLHLFLTGDNPLLPVVENQLAEELLQICSPWTERFRTALFDRFPEPEAVVLYQRYGAAFSDSFRTAHSPTSTAQSIEAFETVRTTRRLVFDFVVPEAHDHDKKSVQLLIYESSGLYLTDVLPILDHFGMRVFDQSSQTVTTASGDDIVVDTFRIDLESLGGFDLVTDKARVTAALSAIFERRMASDRLNTLVILADLTWQQTDLIRAYVGYSRQIVAQYSPDIVQRVLTDNPRFVRHLLNYFHAKFDPDLLAHHPNADRPSLVASAQSAMDDALRDVTLFVQDRILRHFRNLVDATLRTNFFRSDRPFHYISFKLDCNAVEAMSGTRPWREIYVHHVDMEGVHLRGGAVARGGIRWSDRSDDYRQEILGLMTTQMVKNTLIVPVGAKGGFLLKQQRSTDADRRAFADAMYRVLIRGILDITDNRSPEGTLPPPNVVRYDNDDTYLVVAADKGTAHLSDTANQLAAEYRFWLADAFASGGSAGYDHKVEGITAKGAWACTRRHFHEMGIDPERDTIRVVGIGDMSGDVFGNGMLLSKTIQLVAAFDHRHIFIDPAPDPAASFVERERLFKLKSSSWKDYNPDKISPGGGVFDRSAKAIQLSPQAMTLLGIDMPQVSGERVIQAILTLDVDLLWNGGIGTYIKSSEEDNRDVSDKANDSVRVDGQKIRAKVVGEGGNLGATTRGRIEFALAGGHINNDAVDNAGGVNLSDHEVNLKVLFAPLLQNQVLTVVDRDRVMREVCQEVVDRVVADNDLQALRISLDELRSRRDIFAFGRTIRHLRDMGVMDSYKEHMPTSRRQVARNEKKLGLVRPELAVLGAHAKMWAFRELLAAGRLDADMSAEFLELYFPQQILDHYGDAVRNHLLLREILTTVETNLIVDYAGCGFFAEVTAETDRSVPDVALAYLYANRVMDAWSLKKQIRSAEAQLPAVAVYQALLKVEDVLRSLTVWILRQLPGELLISGKERVIAWQDAVQSQRHHVLDWAPEGAVGELRVGAQEWVVCGFQEQVASELAILPTAAMLLPSVEIAHDAAVSLQTAFRVYGDVGDLFGLKAVIESTHRHSSDDKWESLAIRSLRQEFADFRRELTTAVIRRADASRAPGEVAKAFLEQFPMFSAVAADVVTFGESPSVASLFVVISRFRKAMHQMQTTQS